MEISCDYQRRSADLARQRLISISQSQPEETSAVFFHDVPRLVAESEKTQEEIGTLAMSGAETLTGSETEGEENIKAGNEVPDRYNHRHISKEEVSTDLEEDEGEIYRQKLISISYQEIPRICEPSLPNGV